MSRGTCNNNCVRRCRPCQNNCCCNNGFGGGCGGFGGGCGGFGGGCGGFGGGCGCSPIIWLLLLGCC